MSAKGCKVSIIRWISSRDLMYSMVATVNNTVYLKVAMRVNLKCSHCKMNNKNGNYVRWPDCDKHFTIYTYIKTLLVHLTVTWCFISITSQWSIGK